MYRSTLVLSSLCLTGLIGACSDSGGEEGSSGTGGADQVLSGTGGGTADVGLTGNAYSTGGGSTIAPSGGTDGSGLGGAAIGGGTGGAVTTGGSPSVGTGGVSSSIGDATGGNTGVGVTATTATGGNSSATGGNSSATGGNSFATGGNSSATGGNSSATGGNSSATGGNSSATGGNSSATGGNSSATGGNSSATGGNSSATGGNSSATGGNDTGTGGNSSATGGNSSATGGNSSATGGNDTGTGGGENSTCSFTVDYDVSSAIQTVGIVTWSTTSSVTSAYIEFGLEGSGDVMEAPVDLNESSYRTLLLGMKQQSDYVFRIVAESGSGSCVSEDYYITTGTLSGAPTITHSASNASAASRGFIVTTGGIGGGMGGGMGGGSSPAMIFDTDGDVVWAASAPSSASRAHMSWDGKDMWMEALNVSGNTSSGEMRRVSMDGLDVENSVSGLSGAHHDFTVTPNGLAVIVFNSSNCSAIVERSATGTVSNIVADVSSIYQPSGDCHTNYIEYYESDDSFTLSDRNPNLFVKIRHNGTLVWQFGGSNPKGASFQVSEGWQVNHGHELSEDGRFVFFNNGSNGSSKIMEFQLNESSMASSKSWQYAPGTNSGTLGDVVRIPNGHYLVVFSNSGVIHEIDASQALVQSFTGSSFGYADFRESLYGPPIRY